MRGLTTASSAGETRCSTDGRRLGHAPLFVAAMVSLAFLILVPLAQADKGVVGSFGSPTTRGSAAGEMSSVEGIAINSSGAGGVPAGTTYVDDSGNRRIDVFGPSGEFEATWGYNVTGIREVQEVLIEAEGGTFTLSFEGKTTGSLNYNAPINSGTGNIQTALLGLTTIGTGNVSVSGASGSKPTFPRTVTFIGKLAGLNVPQITADASKLTGKSASGGPPSITIKTLVEGSGGTNVGYEICTKAEAPLCNAGYAPTEVPGIGAISAGSGIAVDQADGSVYLADRTLLRVTKFTATGTPLFTYGLNVNKTKVETGGATQAEKNICTLASGNVCNTGTSGATGGAFTGTLGVSVVPSGPSNSGNVVIADGGNRRLQEFTSSGAWVKALGWDVLPHSSPNNISRNEIQTVTIPGSDGTFTLTFNGKATGAIAYNATSSTVQSALTGLTTVGAGNVTVTGGPGSGTGSSPYLVEFSGGSLADSDVKQIEVSGRALGTAPGQTVTCSSPTADITKYQWLRNGAPISGATSKTYEIQGADAGDAIQCQVYASLEVTQSVGQAMVQTSYPAINVTPLPVSPARPVPPATLPAVTATFAPGQSNKLGADGGYTLKCTPGTWQNTSSNSFSYQWYKSGKPLSGHGANTEEYVVQPQDLKSRGWFQCGVTATNASGSITLMTNRNGSFGIEIVSDPTSTLSSAPSSTPTSTQILDLASVVTSTPGAALEACIVSSECRAGAAEGSQLGTPAGEFGPERVLRTAVDSNGVIYAVEAGGSNPRVHRLAPAGGAPGVTATIFAPSILNGSVNGQNTDNALDVAIGPGNTVLFEKRAPVNATPVCFDGSSSQAETRVIELANDGSTITSVDGACARLLTSNGNLAVNLASGDVYLAQGESPQRVYIFGAMPSNPTVSINAPEPTASNALITGTVNPNPVPSLYPNPSKTTWLLQYKKHTSGTWGSFRTPTNIGAASEDVSIRTTLLPLLANTEYDVRIVATKELNSAQTIGEVKSFTTLKAPPAILSTKSHNVAATSADLDGTVDPRGTDTTYYFEWGTSESYGNKTSETDIGSGQGAQDATAHITGLQDTTYHFRLVATNEAGTVFGEDQTLNFHPPQCPNALVRQQTGAGFLPDCRAYELVSPSAAGNTIINSFTGPTSGAATNPPRLAYVGMFSPLALDEDPPNWAGDLYVSTRTDKGWVTHFVGGSATESFAWGGPPGATGSSGYLLPAVGGLVPASPDLSKVLLWNLGEPQAAASGSSNAPYLFSGEGGLIERWPTNLSQIPSGATFKAETWALRTSADLSHFVFKSSIPFLPGAPATAIYDDDTSDGSLHIVSFDPGGNPFSGFPVELSEDGSHILMSTLSAPPGGPIPASHLYMSVDDAHIYDVTEGHSGVFAGMTANGHEVFFTSAEKIMPGESDTSTDLFKWDEETNALTKVSGGTGGTGDTDACSPIESWTSKCSIKLIFNYEYQGLSRPRFFNNKFANQTAGGGGRPGNDSALASETGDIYFYSPEKLAGPGNGAEGMQNLYVYRDGNVQFVATLDPGELCRKEAEQSSTVKYCAAGPIGRFQVTANGAFAAFTAATKLTSYENAGIEEMYRYESGTGRLICVSCLPSGEPPSVPVSGSQNGLFLAANGRTFFSTSDSLAPNDTNEALDIYEYVEGAPHLITTGTGTTKVPFCPKCGLGQFTRAGLIGISANGQNVYFGTNDVLTSDDHNGGSVKIYDARTNGGFVVASTPQPCQAADECHGSSSSPPPVTPSGTSENVSGGNAQAKKHHKKIKRHKKKRPHHLHKRRHGQAGGGK